MAVPTRLSAAFLALAVASLAQADDAPPLKSLVPQGVLIGAAMNHAESDGRDDTARRIAARHFSTITPVNLLKWALVQPQPERFDFAPVDRFVAFGERHGMFVVGHTLIWHAQTPAWVFAGANGGLADRDTMLARMRVHIEAVVGRYRGRVRGWDVVNEALAEDGGLRQSSWLRGIGEDYIAKAFEYAHAADPGAELYYNDYGLWRKPKRDGALRLALQLRQRGLRIDGIGEQGHWSLESPSVRQIEATLEAIGEAGLQPMITELDIDVLPRPASNWTDASKAEEMRAASVGYREGLPSDRQKQLARRYAEIFGVVRKRRGSLARVTFWGVTDAASWLNNYPVPGHANHPLLWDRAGREKPAFTAVVEALRKK